MSTPAHMTCMFREAAQAPQAVRAQLAISRSGASPDLLAVVAKARKAGARIVALVNAERSPLAELADELLPLHAGAERSVAATKSYIASLSAIVQLVAEWSGDRALTRHSSAPRSGWSAPGSSTGVRRCGISRLRTTSLSSAAVSDSASHRRRP